MYLGITMDRILSLLTNVAVKIHTWSNSLQNYAIQFGVCLLKHS